MSLDDWKTYLRWHLIHSAALALSSKFVRGEFQFLRAHADRGQGDAAALAPLRGIHRRRARRGAWASITCSAIFRRRPKPKRSMMVKNLIAALRDDLSTLDWMSPATREQAIKKLKAINLKIGYPGQVARLFGLQGGSRFLCREQDAQAANLNFEFDLAKIGKPVDRTEWDMTPPTVNAYYSPQKNEIVFPAGILQPPFFDPNGDPAINYGGIGAVIGHEMTHGFDDQGAQVRRGRESEELVDAAGPEEFQAARRLHRQAVRGVRTRRPPREREAGGGREHRRSGRPHDFPRRFRKDAAGKPMLPR